MRCLLRSPRFRTHAPGTARALAVVLLQLLPAGTLQAQALRPGASTRATTTVTLTPRDTAGAQSAVAPAQPVRITIDYGQPHARGRTVAGALEADLDSVWRLGANDATSLVTGVDLIIGTLPVPRGEYTLYAQTARRGDWHLIVSRKTQQLGTDYDRAQDLGRVPLRSRTLAAPLESLSIWLIPAGDGSPRGELRFAWGTREFSTEWRVR
ncbi:MAG TPA: DUF2911 domain-containing protein [Gemmatimonadaceae bacterium]|nr:DUF2911 domain-containing protein [Gemmatimonadaceae bacterium]